MRVICAWSIIDLVCFSYRWHTSVRRSYYDRLCSIT